MKFLILIAFSLMTVSSFAQSAPSYDPDCIRNTVFDVSEAKHVRERNDELGSIVVYSKDAKKVEKAKAAKGELVGLILKISEASCKDGI